MESLLSLTKEESVLVYPAEETPNSILYLTEMDIVSPGYMPCLSVYKSDERNPNTKNVAKLIKNALAQVLVFYYPLAGRLIVNGDDGGLQVNCNSQGVLFAEAEAKCTLEDVCFLKEPYNASQDSSLFLHFDVNRPLQNYPFLTLQITRFKCGGFVIGMRMSHWIMDGHGSSRFTNGLAEIMRTGSLSSLPVWERHLLAPRQPPQIKVNALRMLLESGCSRRPMCHATFDIPKGVIELVKLQQNQNVSSFEAAVSLIWYIYSEAMQFPLNEIGFHILVDGRKALNKVLPEGYYGNCVLSVEVTNQYLMEGQTKDYDKFSAVVRAMRRAKERVDEEYVRSWIDSLSEERATKKRVPDLMLTDKILFNDWTKFSWTADFGVGKGVHFAIPLESVCPMHPFILFLPNRGDSAPSQAWVALPPETMNAFHACFANTIHKLPFSSKI